MVSTNTTSIATSQRPKTLEALSIVPIERIYILVNPFTSPLAYFSSITHLSVFDCKPDLLDALLVTSEPRTRLCPRLKKLSISDCFIGVQQLIQIIESGIGAGGGVVPLECLEIAHGGCITDTTALLLEEYVKVIWFEE